MKTGDLKDAKPEDLEIQYIEIYDPVSIIIPVRYHGDKAIVVDQRRSLPQPWSV